jgi:hypothetical protein
VGSLVARYAGVVRGIFLSFHRFFSLSCLGIWGMGARGAVGGPFYGTQIINVLKHLKRSQHQEDGFEGDSAFPINVCDSILLFVCVRSP